MKITEEIKKNIGKIFVIVIIALFLEIFLFNIGSFRLVGKDYQSKIVSIEDCELQGLEKIDTNSYRVTSDNPVITIKEIQQECGTMYFNLQKMEGDKVQKVTLFYSDETSEGLRNLPTKTIYTDIEQSKYTTLHLSGNVNTIAIRLETEVGTVLELKEFQFNKPIPFHFQGLRFLLIVGILGAIYALFSAKTMDEKLNLKEKKQFFITYFLGVAICVIFATYTINAATNKSFLVIPENTTYHDYIYEVEYTNALCNGSLKLLMEVDEGLLQLKNPYDETARTAIDYKQMYDYVYYDGAYYVYFSILPQLILVPFHLLTGYYLNLMWLVVIFMILGVISTIKLINAVFQYWFPDSKFRMFVLAILLVLFSNTLLYTVASPAVYELVAVLGYWLVTGGIYRILTALKNPEKISYRKLAIGSLMLACAVSARPNLIIMSLFVLPIFLSYFIKLAKQKERRKDWIKYIIAIAIPYLVVGIALMVLNYVRFGSVTEFGAVYQLTSNDMAKLGYRVSTIPIGIWHYFFNPADISAEFPFINTRPNMPQYMGFYGTGFAGVGIFMLMPICILIFFLPLLKKEIQKHYPKLWFFILDAIIVAVISAIVVTLVGASYYRYSLDFIWLISIVGVCLMMVVHQRLKKDELIAKLFEGICIVLTLYTICITLGVSVRSETKYLERANPEIYYQIKEDVCFWE